MKNKKSIGRIVFISVICVLLPVHLLMIGIYMKTYDSMRDMILSNQQNALELFAQQLEARLTQVQKYALSVLADRDYVGIRYGKGSTEYEVAKTMLQFAMTRVGEGGFWSNVDGNYAYIPHTEDLLEFRDASVISNTVNQEIAAWMREGTTTLWRTMDIGGHKYICAVWGNGIYNIGVFVSEDTLCREWMESNLGEITILPAGASPEGFGDVVLSQSFASDRLELYCNIPERMLKQKVPVIYIFLLMALVAGTVVTGILYLLFRKAIATPLEAMKQTIGKIKSGDRQARMDGCRTTSELEAIQLAFNELMDEIYEMKIQAYELALENEKAKLTNLQLQINPHLLLNTLNTVYGLAEIREYENIQKFTQNLVSYFRYSLRDIGHPVQLRQELDFIRAFTEIQKIRYPDTFYVVYDVDEELMDLPVLPLMIENFVENSTKYASHKGLVEILVIVKRSDDYMKVSICDDGKGMAPEVLEAIRKGQPYERAGEVHVGIWNCGRRLKLFYGDAARFSITSVPGEGTQVWMEYPCAWEQQRPVDRLETIEGGMGQ